MKKLLIVTPLLLILAGVFYWFEIRPIPIRKSCAEESTTLAKEKAGWQTNRATDYSYFVMPDDVYSFYYNSCLNRNGLE